MAPEIPPMGEDESSVAYFYRIREIVKSPWDATGVVALTWAASVAGLAASDRNERTNRKILEEIRSLTRRLEAMFPDPFPSPEEKKP